MTADETEGEAAARRGIVLSGTGGVWRVRREDGSVVEASLRGRVKKSSSGRRADGSLRRHLARDLAHETHELVHELDDGVALVVVVLDDQKALHTAVDERGAALGVKFGFGR